jgi:hypothetical protein
MNDPIAEVQVYGSQIVNEGSAISLDLRCIVATWPGIAGRMTAVFAPGTWPVAETVELLPINGQKEALPERWKMARRGLQNIG